MMSKNAGNTCEIVHIVAQADIESSGVWRLGAALRLMESAAEEHCIRLGIDRETLYREKGLVWMLSRICVERMRDPLKGEPLTVRTVCAGPGNVTYPRWFEIEDASGNRICSAASLWVLADLKSRRIVLPKRTGVICPEAGFPVLKPLPGKLRIPEGILAFTSIHDVRPDEIDANGHVNNTRYADWLCGGLPGGTVKAMQLDYSAEILLGDSVNILYYATGLGYDVSGVVSNRNITAFNARIINNIIIQR